MLKDLDFSNYERHDTQIVPEYYVLKKTSPPASACSRRMSWV
jgi:hypothetical protein